MVVYTQEWPGLARKRCALRHTATELNGVDRPSRVRAGGSMPNTAAALMRGPSFLVAGLPGSLGQASYDARNTRNQQVVVRNVGHSSATGRLGLVLSPL